MGRPANAKASLMNPCQLHIFKTVWLRFTTNNQVPFLTSPTIFRHRLRRSEAKLVRFYPGNYIDILLNKNILARATSLRACLNSMHRHPGSTRERNCNRRWTPELTKKSRSLEFWTGNSLLDAFYSTIPRHVKTRPHNDVIPHASRFLVNSCGKKDWFVAWFLNGREDDVYLRAGPLFAIVLLCQCCRFSHLQRAKNNREGSEWRTASPNEATVQKRCILLLLTFLKTLAKRCDAK